MSNKKENDEEENDVEPVLLVPPPLTKSSYAILVKNDYVGRPWHPEGRYGSRTHKVAVKKEGEEKGYKIGLPLLKHSTKIDFIKQIMKEKEECGCNNMVALPDSGDSKKTKTTLRENDDEIVSKDDNGENSCNTNTTKNNKQSKKDEYDNKNTMQTNDAKKSLYHLIQTPGVTLIHKAPIQSNRIPKVQTLDATVHEELKMKNFELKLKHVLEERISNCGKQLTGKKRKSSMISSPSSSTSKFTFCELFAGIGGFGVALEKLGGKCIFASEIYKPSISVFSSNLDISNIPGKYIWGDIWDIDTNDIPKHDLLVAGFPCQPFSSLGLQPGLEDDKVISGRKFGNGGDKKEGGKDGEQNENQSEKEEGVTTTNQNGGGRGQLFTQIVRVLKDCQPKAFLLENVPGLLTTAHYNQKNGTKTTAWHEIEKSLIHVGYHVYMEVISSRGLTAQARKRLYIVGIRKQEEKQDGDGHDDEKGSSLTKSAANVNTTDNIENPAAFKFPFMPDLGLRAVDILHTHDELNDTVTSSSSFSAMGIPESLLRILQEKNQDVTNSITPASLFRISNAQFDQLQNRSKSWKPAKLAWDNKTCDTIDSHYGISVGKGNSQLVPSPAPYHPRRFTPRECARIMGFPNTFKLGDFDEKRFSSCSSEESRFNGFIKEQYYMLGNAVCPPVVAVIAGAILDHILDDVIDNEEKEEESWVDEGLWASIDLSLDAVSHLKLDAVCKRLCSSLCG